MCFTSATSDQISDYTHTNTCTRTRNYTHAHAHTHTASSCYCDFNSEQCTNSICLLGRDLTTGDTYSACAVDYQIDTGVLYHSCHQQTSLCKSNSRGLLIPLHVYQNMDLNVASKGSIKSSMQLLF